MSEKICTHNYVYTLIIRLHTIDKHLLPIKIRYIDEYSIISNFDKKLLDEISIEFDKEFDEYFKDNNINIPLKKIQNFIKNKNISFKIHNTYDNNIAYVDSTVVTTKIEYILYYKYNSREHSTFNLLKCQHHY